MMIARADTPRKPIAAAAGARNTSNNNPPRFYRAGRGAVPPSSTYVSNAAGAVGGAAPTGIKVFRNVAPEGRNWRGPIPTSTYAANAYGGGFYGIPQQPTLDGIYTEPPPANYHSITGFAPTQGPFYPEQQGQEDGGKF